MIHTRHFFAAVCSVLLLFSCQEAAPVPPLSKQEKLARAFCECTVELDALNQKSAILQNKALPQDSINVFFHSLQTEYTKARECLAAAISQYGKLKPDDYPEMVRHLQQQCPNMARDKDFIMELLGE